MCVFLRPYYIRSRSLHHATTMCRRCALLPSPTSQYQSTSITNTARPHHHELTTIRVMYEKQYKYSLMFYKVCVVQNAMYVDVFVVTVAGTTTAQLSLWLVSKWRICVTYHTAYTCDREGSWNVYVCWYIYFKDRNVEIMLYSHWLRSSGVYMLLTCRRHRQWGVPTGGGEAVGLRWPSHGSPSLVKANTLVVINKFGINMYKHIHILFLMCVCIQPHTRMSIWHIVQCWRRRLHLAFMWNSIFI